jgi:hypothetical protein
MRRLFPALMALMFLGLAAIGGAQAAEPYGSIGVKYAALGGARSALGPAIGNEAEAPYGGRYHLFKNGMIYWHPEIGEAFAVWGAISAKYWELGRTEYGYPITDERTTPDGRGRYNHFRAMHLPGRPESSIYWSPQTGAHAIFGAIRDAWAADGWEKGSLGFPTSDEFQDGRFRRVNFERGYITWSGDTGAKLHRSGAPIILMTPPKTFGSLMIRGMEVSLKGSRIAGDPNFLSENVVCAEWNRNLGDLNEAAKAFVRSTANPHMRGFSIRSDARMALSAACSFRVDVPTACPDTVRLHMLLPRNLFQFHVTTPGPVGSWSDPEFSVDFDLEAITTVRLPRNGQSSIGLGPTIFRVANVRLDSQNVSGDALMAVNAVYTAISGQDLTGMLTQDRRAALPGVTARLSDLNPALNRIPANYGVRSCVAEGEILRLDGTDLGSSEPVVK